MRTYAHSLRVARLVLAFALLTGTGGGACRRSVPGALPLPPAVVNITMREFSLDRDRPIPAGRVLFRARNLGRVDHQLYLVVVDEQSPPVAETFRARAREVLSPLAYLPAVPPGGTATFAHDLPVGRYALICLLQDDEGESHAAKGMNLEFRAR